MYIRATRHLYARRPRSKLLLACGALLFAAYSLALSCIEFPVESHFERSDVVFAGSVASIKDAPEAYNSKWVRPERNEEWEIPSLEIKLEVEDVWKGTLDKEVLIYTSNTNFSSSGYPFEKNNRYVVFARFQETEESSEQTEVHLETSWCAGNILLGDGENDTDLGKLSKNVLHREHGELETEANLVERLEDLRSKLEDSESTEHAEEDTKQ